MNPIDDQARQRVAEALLEAVTDHRPLAPELRHAFGVLSSLHELALARAIREGRLELDALVQIAWDRTALRERLAGLRAEVGLVFDTTLGYGDQQSVDEQGLRFDEQLTIDERGELRVRVSNPVELWRAATTAMLEPETLEWLQATVGTDSVVYDVGANIGIIALHAWRLGPAQVVAFEPEPLNYARLVENIALNRASNILALPLALTDRDALGEYYYRDFVRGAASPRALDPSDQPAPVRVACVQRRLDSLRGEGPLEPPTHLKIDVDGHEPQVLAGAEHTLASETLRHILIELQAPDFAPQFRRLVAAGFRHVGGRPHGGGVGNYIFERW